MTTYNAKRDMEALARHPAIRAIDIDPGSKRGGGEDDVERDVAADRSRTLSMLAQRRLSEMCAREHPEGERFARIVFYVYGQRGEALNRRESPFEATALRFAGEMELAAHAATLTGMPRVQAKAMAAVSLGGVMIDLATYAYERDQWPARPVVSEPMEMTLAERMAAAMRKHGVAV